MAIDFRVIAAPVIQVVHEVPVSGHREMPSYTRMSTPRADRPVAAAMAAA
jgi:hypothetical protein